MPRKRISAKNFNTDIETPKRIRASLTGLQKKEICQINLKILPLLMQKSLNCLVAVLILALLVMLSCSTSQESTTKMAARNCQNTRAGISRVDCIRKNQSDV